MKKILFIIALSVTCLINAQTLEHKIPRDAQAVISVNGNKLFELISLADFNQLNLAKELFKSANKKIDSANTVANLQDFGFDITSKAFYFHQSTDSISYHTLLIKLNKKERFEKLLKPFERDKVVHINGLSILTDYNSITVWNANMLLYSYGDDNSSYFSQHEDDYLKLAKNDDESLYEIKKRVASQWLKTYALKIFSGNSRSILSNSNYTKRKDDKAVASFWIANYSELIDKTMKLSLGALFMNPSEKPVVNSYGIDGVWGNFYFEDNATTLKANMEINKDWIKTYKRMYKSKLNNNFFKYFNQDNVMAYASMSFNMQNTLEEYPKIISNMYSGMMPKYREEINVVSEITSVLLDEEAIGKFITGNLLFVLNDISEKEVTYTSYEYDDDYKRTEVTKTKKETIPDFTVMIGSENKPLISKIIRLGKKYEVINAQANYFKFKRENDIPFDLFFIVKDNIAFLTSSEKQIKAIANGTIKTNLGKHKKILRKNISAFYANGRKILHEIPEKNLSTDEKKFFDFAKENLTEASLTTSRIKGNKIQMELKMDTPAKYGNSLKFFLTFFETFIK